MIATAEQAAGPLLRLVRDRRAAFVLVGGVNTLVGFAWFAVLHLLLGERVAYLGLLVLSYIPAVTSGYTLHRRLVFRVRGDFWGGLVRYTMVNLSSLALNAALLALAVTAIGMPVLPAQALCTLTTVLLSYVAHVRFSFARQHAAPGYPGEPVDDDSRTRASN